eukprot:gene13385-biopygen981
MEVTSKLHADVGMNVASKLHTDGGMNGASKLHTDGGMKVASELHTDMGMKVDSKLHTDVRVKGSVASIRHAFLDPDLARISLIRPARNRTTQRRGRSDAACKAARGRRVHSLYANMPPNCGGEPCVQVCARVPLAVCGLFCGHLVGSLRSVCGQSAGDVCGQVCGRLCGPYVIDLRNLRAPGGQVRATLREVRAKCGQGLASAGAPAGRVRELRASAGRVCGTRAGGDVKLV